MPIRVLIALSLLIAAPLMLLGWVSVSTMRADRVAAEVQIESVLKGRLAEFDTSLQNLFDAIARGITDRLQQATGGFAGDSVSDVNGIVRLQRTEPLVRRVMVVNAKGRLVYPPPPDPSDAARIEEYAALTALVVSRPRTEARDWVGETRSSGFAAGPNVNDFGNSGKRNAADNDSSTGHSLGDSPGQSLGQSPGQSLGQAVYHVWYRDEGTQLSLWWDGPGGSAIGVMLERARWLAEVTAVLPNTSQGIVRVKSDNRLATANSVAEIVKPADATVLSDEAGRVVYRWGGGIDITKEPAAEMMLSEPLSSWRLRYYSAMPLVSPIRFTGMYAAIAGLAILLIALGVYVLTRLQRQIRLAKNRVTFAGLVSHELRTPLTNIILYTELAKEDLIRSGQPASGQISTRLAVIDIESRRLSRLVSGVMEIIREDTRARPPRMESHHADTVIDAVVSHFVPSFDAASIRIDRKRGADAWLKFDADCLEMILVNLLSNVEKYASSGGHVEIGSSIESDRLVVQIGDHGPGIATRYRGAIFKPFRRIDDSVSAPSGTGIGLTIARRVARRHGGDVRLVASPRGACFEVTLTVKATKPRGDGVEGAHGDDRCN